MGLWGIHPSEFWTFYPDEFWWIYEAKKPPKVYAGGLNESDADEIYESLKEGGHLKHG